jgi:alpha-tubulin suppressor-like RCC1 family protein
MQVHMPEPARAVAAGGFTSYALLHSGQLWSWGSNAMGQRGTSAWGWPSHKPSVVEKISDGRLALVRFTCRVQL